MHTESMSNVLIRDLPPAVHGRLKEQAASAGLSLQAHLVRVLARQAEEMTPQEWVAFVERRLGELGVEPMTPMSAVEALDEARAELDARWERLDRERAEG